MRMEIFEFGDKFGTGYYFLMRTHLIQLIHDSAHCYNYLFESY